MVTIDVHVDSKKVVPHYRIWNIEILYVVNCELCCNVKYNVYVLNGAVKCSN